MGQRKDHVIALIGIAYDIYRDGCICRNIGEIQAAAMAYDRYMDACDDIGIPEATCMVKAQYDYMVEDQYEFFYVSKANNA